LEANARLTNSSDILKSPGKLFPSIRPTSTRIPKSKNRLSRKALQIAPRRKHHPRDELLAIFPEMVDHALPFAFLERRVPDLLRLAGCDVLRGT